jgi:adenylylsulfate kinase
MIISSSSRSGAKAVTWRVIAATTTTMSLVYFFTGELDLSLGVGFFDVLLKLAFYFLHERAWDRVWYGRDVKVDRRVTIALGGLVNIENT